MRGRSALTPHRNDRAMRIECVSGISLWPSRQPRRGALKQRANRGPRRTARSPKTHSIRIGSIDWRCGVRLTSRIAPLALGEGWGEGDGGLNSRGLESAERSPDASGMCLAPTPTPDCIRALRIRPSREQPPIPLLSA